RIFRKTDFFVPVSWKWRSICRHSPCHPRKVAHETVAAEKPFRESHQVSKFNCPSRWGNKRYLRDCPRPRLAVLVDHNANTNRAAIKVKKTHKGAIVRLKLRA